MTQLAINQKNVKYNYVQVYVVEGGLIAWRFSTARVAFDDMSEIATTIVKKQPI